MVTSGRESMGYPSWRFLETMSTSPARGERDRRNTFCAMGVIIVPLGSFSPGCLPCSASPRRAQHQVIERSMRCVGCCRCRSGRYSSSAGSCTQSLQAKRSGHAMIGWQTNGFQYEIGFGSFGMGIASSSRRTPIRQSRGCVSIAVSVFLLGAAANHIREMVKDRTSASACRLSL